MKTTVSSKGQIVLPAELRERDAIQPGQQFSIKRLKSGRYVLERLTDSGGLDVAQWLLACPEKGWFKPLPSTDTDSLPTPPW
jgi:AbrB family looped-hinge helix DNA binding protein